MAHLNPENLFQSWKFSETERVQSAILSLLQKQGIQNIIAELAQEKLLLKFTPNDLNTYLQCEAELQGKIGILNHLLDLSRESEKLLDPGSRQLEISL